MSNAAPSVLTDQAAVERREVAYDAEAGYPRALKGLSEMLSQVTTLRRANTDTDRPRARPGGEKAIRSMVSTMIPE
jgi:hypothetical protein